MKSHKKYLLLCVSITLLPVSSFFVAKAIGYNQFKLKRKKIVPVVPITESPSASDFTNTYWKCVSWTKPSSELDLSLVKLEFGDQDYAGFENLPVKANGRPTTMALGHGNYSTFRWRFLSPDQTKGKYWIIDLNDHHFRILRRSDKIVLQYIVEGDEENSLYFQFAGNFSAVSS